MDATGMGELPQTTAAPAPSRLHAGGGWANSRHVHAARRGVGGPAGPIGDAVRRPLPPNRGSEQVSKGAGIGENTDGGPGRDVGKVMTYSAPSLWNWV